MFRACIKAVKRGSSKYISLFEPPIPTHSWPRRVKFPGVDYFNLEVSKASILLGRSGNFDIFRSNLTCYRRIICISRCIAHYYCSQANS